MIKNISRIKVILALISLVLTFFIWQQGLRESLNRPSVAFDISQKEKEIAELLNLFLQILRNLFYQMIQLKK